MATKPLDQLSPAYRKRIQTALAKGKTRQAARGHKAHEHIERAQKNVTRHQLTSYQRQTMRKYARQQAAREDGSDWVDYYEDMVEWVNGDFEKFKSAKGIRDKLVSTYQVEYKKKRRRLKGTRSITEAVQQTSPSLFVKMYTEIPPPSDFWFFYH
jgi:hypothetical protein